MNALWKKVSFKDLMQVLYYYTVIFKKTYSGQWMDSNLLFSNYLHYYKIILNEALLSIHLYSRQEAAAHITKIET